MAPQNLAFPPYFLRITKQERLILFYADHHRRNRALRRCLPVILSRVHRNYPPWRRGLKRQRLFYNCRVAFPLLLIFYHVAHARAVPPTSPTRTRTFLIIYFMQAIFVLLRTLGPRSGLGLGLAPPVFSNSATILASTYCRRHRITFQS